MSTFSKSAILRLLRELDRELQDDDVAAELFLVGGAVMTLALDARPATKGIDALFRPAGAVRRAALRVARKNSLTDDWLNDAAKGYLSANGDFSVYLELSHLRVSVATPEYLFAMKAFAMRLGPEFADADDVRFLLRVLGVSTYVAALEIVERFYPLERLKPKTFYALEEMLGA